MARVRLTDQSNKTAADSKAPYPGSMNQEGREEENRGSMTYRTFEPSVANHEMIDPRTEWKSDAHNEMGFGIPDPASGMAINASYHDKCLKSVQLAEMFLGPKANDRTIIAQAREFLAMPTEAIESSLERFDSTACIYSEDEEAMEAGEEMTEEAMKMGEEEVEAGDAESVPNPAPEAPEGSAAAPDAAPAPVVEEIVEVKEPVVASEKVAKKAVVLAKEILKNGSEEDVIKLAKKIMATTAEEEVVEAEEEGETVEGGSCKAEETPVETEVEETTVEANIDNELKSSTVASINLSEVDFSNELDTGEGVADEKLSSIFEDPKAAMMAGNFTMPTMPMPETKTASKVGVSSIGDKATASATPEVKANQLDSIWNDAPDINSIW